MKLRVESHSGYRGDERPIRFYLGENCFEVKEVQDRWYSPEDSYFRVKANDGNIYVLRHSQKAREDTWNLESFRRSSASRAK